MISITNLNLKLRKQGYPTRRLRAVWRVATALAALLTASASSQASLLRNGDFELGSGIGWDISGSATVVPEAGYFHTGAINHFPVGFQALNFGGGDAPATGVVAQTFDTVAGQRYTLDFDYGKYSHGAGAQVVQVQVVNLSGGQGLRDFSVSDPTGSTNLAVVLSPYHSDFTALGSRTRLIFSDRSPTTVSTDGVLDNVVIAAVPEPAGLALMAVGISMVGFVGRRRTRR
jgi:hypothetical protein